MKKFQARLTGMSLWITLASLLTSCSGGGASPVASANLSTGTSNTGGTGTTTGTSAGGSCVSLVQLIAVQSGSGCSSSGTAGGSTSSTACATTFTVQTANPNATCATKTLLNKLAQLAATASGPNIYSGLFMGWSQNNSGSPAYNVNMDQWKSDSTAHLYPMIMQCDYAGPNDPIPNGVQFCNPPELKFAAAGGIVAICLHLANPLGGGSSMSDSDFASLADLSSANGQKFEAELDQVSAGLAQFQAAGIPVLFRPLLEMTESYAWWDGHPSSFPAVWQSMYTYMTTTKGLNNILWMYAPQDGHPASVVTEYYGGAQYTDIVAIDVYSDPNQLAPLAQALRALPGNKVFGIAEMGGPYGSWPSVMQSVHPSFFMTWSDQWSPTQGGSAGTTFINDPSFINMPSTTFAL